MGIVIRWSLAFLVVNVVGMWEVKMGASAAGLSAAKCKEERRIGLNECEPVLYGKLPSPSCCERVRVSHIESVCPVITPRLAALIDVNRAIRLIERLRSESPSSLQVWEYHNSLTYPSVN